MKNKKRRVSKTKDIARTTKHESGKTEPPAEPDLNQKIFIKTWEDSIRPYFSSPCLLPEIEDDEDVNNG